MNTAHKENQLKLEYSTGNSFKIPVKEWECYPRFLSAFLGSALNFGTNMH